MMVKDRTVFFKAVVVDVAGALAHITQNKDTVKQLLLHPQPRQVSHHLPISLSRSGPHVLLDLELSRASAALDCSAG